MAAIIGLIAGIAFFGHWLVMLTLLTDLWAVSLRSAALFTSIMPATMAVLAVFAGRLIDRVGYRRVMVPGAVIYAAAFALPLLLLTEERQWWLVIVSLIGAGIGMATVWPPLMAAATAGVPRDRVATATATINTVQRIGGAVGSAIAVAWIAAGPSGVLATHRNPLWLLVIGGVGIALAASALTDEQSTRPEALAAAEV